MMMAIRILIRLVFTINFGFLLSIIFLKILCFKNRERFAAKLSDKYLELLLRVLDLAFEVSEDFRKNLKNFDGKYVFTTKDKKVCSSAVFMDNDMKVYDREIEDWDIMIVFQDYKVLRKALKRIILTGNIDLLDSLLQNEIQTIGNVNYAFKFLFLINNLTHRIGIA